MARCIIERHVYAAPASSSALQVSDAPEVHSNGFHVAFSRTMYGNLGMVLPTNVPPYDGSQLPSQLGLTPAPTVIRLPLKGAGGAGGGREAYGADGAEAEDAAAAAVAAMRTGKAKCSRGS